MFANYFDLLADSPLMYFAQNESYLPGFNEDAILSFEPGKTYRLRIINTAAFAMFYFWIDGHEMRIIEADGVRLCFHVVLL